MPRIRQPMNYLQARLFIGYYINYYYYNGTLMGRRVALDCVQNNITQEALCKIILVLFFTCTFAV